jgi:hypothetical protein
LPNGTELKEYRQKVLTLLLNSKTTCELVLNRIIPDITLEIQDELTSGYIYNYAFVPNVQEDQKTYIAFELSGRKPNKASLYTNMKLYFYIFSHCNIIKHPTGYLRTDLIDEQIQSIFNENKDIGIGKMYCTSDDYLKVSNFFYGRQLCFEVKEQSISGCK